MTSEIVRAAMHLIMLPYAAMPSALRRTLLALLFALPIYAKDVDILITGGTVLTMAGPNIDSGSVVISGGKIVAVGPSSTIDAKYQAKTTIHAKGSAILPGFVNAHTHI